jgi:leucyl-tRNA synthetase
MTENRKSLLLHIFIDLIKLLYPIIPHVTEEIWEIMGYTDLYLEKLNL